MLLLTTSNVYKLDHKSFAVHKQPVPLAKLTGVALGPATATLLVMTFEEPVSGQRACLVCLMLIDPHNACCD